MEEYLTRHVEQYLRQYQEQQSWKVGHDDESIDQSNDWVYHDDDESFYYVGFDSGLRTKDEILDYLIRLRQGLEYSEDVSVVFFSSFYGFYF